MIFCFKTAQDLIAEHYGRYFDMIFHFKAAQIFVAEHYEIDFDFFFHFMQLNTWLQNTVKEDRLIYGDEQK